MKQIPGNHTDMYVVTGQLATGSKNDILITSPLGSCVAVVAYDKTTKIGGIAHIMLPGKSPTEDKADENKYAQNAIENLFNELKSINSNIANIEFCLVGGANVLKKDNDIIADNLILSIFEIMDKKS